LKKGASPLKILLPDFRAKRKRGRCEQFNYYVGFQFFFDPFDKNIPFLIFDLILILKQNLFNLKIVLKKLDKNNKSILNLPQL
jgi:hypothetical protein